MEAYADPNHPVRHPVFASFQQPPPQPHTQPPFTQHAPYIQYQGFSRDGYSYPDQQGFHEKNGTYFQPTTFQFPPAEASVAPAKKKKNKGKKKKNKKAIELSKEEQFRQTLSVRERRMLSNYAGHFLGLLQMEIDEEIRDAIRKHRTQSTLRLLEQGLVLVNATGSLVKLGAQHKKKALKKLAMHPSLALGNTPFIGAESLSNQAAHGASGMEQNHKSDLFQDQHVEVLVRFTTCGEYYAQLQPHAFMPGDLIWIRAQTQESYDPGSLNEANSGEINMSEEEELAHPEWKILFEGVVDNCGKDFLVASFSFPAALEASKTQDLLCGLWRVDKGPSIVSYKRMLDAVKIMTSHQFQGPAALRHIVCRLHNHAKFPKQDPWDTSTPPDPDPRYHWHNFGWNANDPELSNRDLCIDPRVNHVSVTPQLLQQARSVLSQHPLNKSQQESITQVLSNRLTLIQGPPGTGKTTTSVYLLKLWVHDLGMKPALACAFSNVAVDQMLAGLIKCGVEAVRIGDPERVNSDLQSRTMKYREENHPLAPELAQLKEQLKMIRHRLHQGDSPQGLKDLSMTYKRVKKLQKQIEDDILNSCDVILATCIGAGSIVLQDRMFSLILVDECTQATEPSCLIPLVKAKPDAHVVLIGDQCQLPPTMSCDKLKYTGLKISLFERMLQIPVHEQASTCPTPTQADPVSPSSVAMTSFSSTTMPFMGILPIRLLTQYRMHPLISEWPNQAFYDGHLSNGVSASDRVPPRGFPWPGAGPVCLVPSHFHEDAVAGKSKRNTGEASVVLSVVQLLLAGGDLVPAEIGIVTPYVGQVRQLRKLFGGTGRRANKRMTGGDGFERPENEELGVVVEEGAFANLEIMSVDGYQGREKEVIVFSCVRSNNVGNVGFLADRRRLNVAITRARRGLVVVGNPTTLETHPVWKPWLNTIKEKQLLVSHTAVGEILQQKRQEGSAAHLLAPPPTGPHTPSPPESPREFPSFSQQAPPMLPHQPYYLYSHHAPGMYAQ